MTGFVLDCSVTLSWFLPGELTDSNQAVRKMIEGGASASVPCLWALEVANALLVAERRKRISRRDSEAAWAALEKLPTEVDAETGQRAGRDILTLARRQQLSIYDAAYLELAVRLGIPLASLDELLRAAARRLKIPVLPEDI
jgi:predicted nucleic acid-binding protein